jgi:hypothetical protein
VKAESIQSGYGLLEDPGYCRHSEIISLILSCLKGVFLVGAGYTNPLKMLGQWYTSC